MAPLPPLLLLLLSALLPLPSNSVPASSAAPRQGGPVRLSDARIGIVGGGPAGLHMAYLLRKLSFSNVVVLEASQRVGGRSVTIPDGLVDDLVHEMGTCYVNSDYGDLRRMASNIDYRLDEVRLPEAVVRLPADSVGAGAPQPVPLAVYVLDRVRRLDPSLRPNSTINEVALRINTAIAKYLTIREKYFPPGQPDYHEFPLTRPSPELLSGINITVREFLEAQDLLPLEPYFLLGMTAMGYGSVEDTSALYGLMWMTPKYLSDISNTRNSSKLAMLGRGFQNFWEATRVSLQSDGVEFRFNSRVAQVIRSNSEVRLQLEGGKSVTFDWLVWTPNAAKTLGVFADRTSAEAAAFAGLSARKFRTCLVRLPGPEPAVAADAVAYYADVLENRHLQRLDRLLAVRNSAKILAKPATAAPPGKGRDKSGPSTLVAYYLSGYPGDLGGDLGDCRLLNSSQILADMTFDYMPRYSVADMAGGVLWRVLHDVQGANLTWFTGHSVVFDSVKSVMKYNKMLLRVKLPDLADRLEDI